MANFHSINGNEVEAHYAGGDLRDEINLKADSDGYYTMLTAGAADNLTARGDGVTASYLYRTTGGSASVPDDAKATVRSIKGRTLGWNQLCEYAGQQSTTINDVTITDNGDGSFTFNGTASAQVTFNVGTRKPFPIGHKELVLGCPAGGSAYGSYRLKDGYGTAADIGSGIIETRASYTPYAIAQVVIANGYTCNNLVFTPQLFDLTAMFGAGNEPTTVAEFTALYPEKYYPYDAGTLLPVNMTGVETVGFNLLANASPFEMTVSGYANTLFYNDADGLAAFKANLKDLQQLGGTLYWHIAATNTTTTDAPVGQINLMSGDNVLKSIAPNATFSLAGIDIDSVTGVILYGPSSGSATFSEACINLSWSGYRNGEYEAHWSEQRVIAAIAENFPDGMRSAGSVADELTEHEAIHRVDVVDLGTLTWTAASTNDSDYKRFKVVDASIPSNIKHAIDAGIVGNIKCQKYDAVADSATYMRTTGISLGTAGALSVFDSSYNNDVSAFTTAMSGVYLFYELATPTTTPFPQPINMDYRFADFGTERIIVPEGAMSAPPTMDVVYGLNAPDTLRTLPTEYVSKASDASFTAALGAFLNATITREWNETNQRYNYTITANGE